MDNRAISPVIEKTVTVGLVVLFISGFGGSLLTGTVPDYRASTGQEVGERVLATAASSIESANPSTTGTVDVRREQQLPGTIDDEGYRLVLQGRQLRLAHPDPAIGATTRLALPEGVTITNSTWDGGPFVVKVRGPVADRRVELGGEGP
jgi:hypothetical protein